LNGIRQTLIAHRAENDSLPSLFKGRPIRFTPAGEQEAERHERKRKQTKRKEKYKVAPYSGLF